MFISLRQQKLRSCKRIGCEFYCEELFVVKHKSSYSCESAIYFNLTTDIIKNNCNFKFYFNKTDITPVVLDGGDKIVLANWPNDKHTGGSHLSRTAVKPNSCLAQISVAKFLCLIKLIIIIG